MEEIEYRIIKYDDSKMLEWDDFIETSLNGVFLHTRRFLNYHPQKRFEDCSLLIYDKKNNLVALCPACCKYENDNKVFYSHQGSTFGGIVLSKKICHVDKFLDIIVALEDYCKLNGFNKIVLKHTSDLFSIHKNDLIEYGLYYLGYGEFKELNLYIDYSKYNENILSNFSQGKRTNINNCIKCGVELRKLKSREEIECFYNILCQTLEKYNKLPVHNLDELMLLKDKILLNECEFFGAFLDNKMIAGAMVFYFHKTNIAHTQYLCALHEYDTLSAMTYMYYAMIKYIRESGFKGISFGIATEDNGKKINMGLMLSKEAFGASHSVNRTFYKNLF